MINKTTIIIFLFFSNLFLIAQEKSFCGEVIYEFNTNFAYQYKESYKMTFNDSISYSEEINIRQTESNSKNDFSDQGLTKKFIAGRKIEKPKFFLNKGKDFYFSDILGDYYLIVKEDTLDWQWNITEEFKKIGNFDCQKATITFRGRIYTAWFTNQIPVSYGPWKFKGLSGLILEVYDSDNKLYIVAKNVNFNSVKTCNFTYNKNLVDNYLTINQYLNKQKDFLKDFFKQLSSKLPKDAKPLVYDENCEDCKEGMLEIFE